MSDEQKGFDPARFLTRVNGREYLEVKWRLLWFRTDCPDGVIETELIRADREIALFKATVRKPSGSSATGYGSETPGDFGEYIEKAETKALGRALAALGYGTQFSHEFERTDKGFRFVDSPVDAPANGTVKPAVQTAKAVADEHHRQQMETPTKPPTNGTAKTAPAPAQQGLPPASDREYNPPTDAQIRAVRAIQRQNDMSELALDELCRSKWSLPLDMMSKREVSELIDVLKR